MRSVLALTIAALGLALSATAHADLMTDDGNLYIDNGQVNDFPPRSVPGTVYVRNGFGVNSGPTTINLGNGGLIRDLVLYQDSRANIFGGLIADRLEVHQNSIVTISGGTVGGDVFTHLDSMLTISGGTIEGDLHVVGDSMVLLIGTFNFDYGDYFADSELDDSRLTGTLADGSSFDSDIYIIQDGKVTLAPLPIQNPEPASVMVWLLVSLVGALTWKRLRARHVAG